VEVVGEELPCAAQEPVERAGDADGETLHSARERDVVVGFDDQVQMVAQHGEFDQSRAVQSARCSETASKLGEAA
jgi:hypothetical protein